MPKKGVLSNCENYRDITQLSVPGRVFSRIILNRMKDVVDAQLRDWHTGFRKDPSSTDQIATLCIILEQSRQSISSLYINFLDFEKAFDSVDIVSIWKLFRHFGFPEKIAKIIKNTCDGLCSEIS